MYKGVGGWERGGVGSGVCGKLEVGYTFQWDCLAMSPRTTSHRCRQAWRPKRHLANTGVNVRPIPPIQCLHGPHCLDRDFTWSAKSAPDKQTSQLSPSIQQCMGSVQVWLLAGPIKCNWPSVTIWSIYANPVTILMIQHPFVKFVRFFHHQSFALYSNTLKLLILTFRYTTSTQI